MAKPGLLAGTILFAAALGVAQAQDGGTVEHIKIRSAAVEGNLQGNAVDRDVIVYLPPSYATATDRRYPVVYHLHGWLPDAEEWAGMIDLQAGADRAIASGNVREMIVVLPDGYSIYGGGMYSSSVTTGDMEGFVVRDVIDYVDSHYRTISERASRGLSGHSMGGYGAARIAMKFPELYSSVYIMSACCLVPFGAEDPNIAQAAELKSVEEAINAPVFVRVQLTQAAAWSPNPARPPLYMDFPFEDGKVRPEILAKWDANVPLAMIDQYVRSLRSYSAIGLEVGLQDGFLESNRQLDQVLSTYGIEHSFATFEGGHVDRGADRLEHAMLPFFSEHLQDE